MMCGYSSAHVRRSVPGSLRVVIQLVTRCQPHCAAPRLVAYRTRFTVVSELDLTVHRTALFQRSLSELRFLFSTVLVDSHGFWRSCAPDDSPGPTVPSSRTVVRGP